LQILILTSIFLLLEINLCFEAIDALSQNMSEVSHNMDKDKLYSDIR